MKLIIELFLIFVPLYLCQPGIYFFFLCKGELPKYGCEKIYPGEFVNPLKGYYINTSNFRGDEYLYFKIIMNHGHFRDDIMIFQGSNDIPKKIIVTIEQTSYDSCSRTSSNFTNTKNYITETHYYSVEKNTYNYIFVSPSYGEFYYSDNRSFIEVCSLEKKGISIGIWIGAGAFVLVVYILIIILYQYKRAPKQKHIDTTAFEPFVINVSPSTNASNQNI